MKNLKRTLAVFVSAVMVMAMLAGCGGSSVGSRLREVTKAGVSTSANKVASTLAEGKTVDSDTVKAAVESVASSDSYTVKIETETHNSENVFKTRIVDEDNKNVDVYYVFTEKADYEEAVVVSANTVFESVKTRLDGTYTGIEYSIAAYLMDAEAGEYVIVICADFANVA